MSALPTVQTRLPVEPYAARDPGKSCEPTEKPGVVAFRAFTLSHLGGRDLGIVRACDVGTTSEHHEGRAWDWGLSASDPADVERAQTMIDWLLASEGSEPHANFRRAGLRYMIWNHQIWSPGQKAWRPYTGTNPHTDHMHLSFSWDGALKKTSLYEWLDRGAPSGPLPAMSAERPAAAAFAIGAALGWWGSALLR